MSMIWSFWLKTIDAPKAVFIADKRMLMGYEQYYED